MYKIVLFYTSFHYHFKLSMFKMCDLLDNNYCIILSQSMWYNYTMISYTWIKINQMTKMPSFQSTSLHLTGSSKVIIGNKSLNNLKSNMRFKSYIVELIFNTKILTSTKMHMH